MARTLEERLSGDDPEPWIPEEAGESIFGEVEEISKRPDAGYGEYDVVVLITPDDEVRSVAIFGTVLKNKFAELAPNEGDELGFKFLGEQVPKSGGKPYKNWRLIISRKTVVSNDPEPVGAAVGNEFGDE